MMKNDTHAGCMTIARPFVGGCSSGSFVLDYLVAKYAAER
jgi:hypothetical protein